MANLSNINGKFVVEQTTGYVGVGTTDPNYPIEVLNASAEIALNASGASIYRLRSDSTDSFRINKNGVGDRLVINGAGNATFAGSVEFSGGVVRLIANQLQSGYNADSEDSDFWINYQGYQGGTTRYRDFRIGNGKQGQIAFFDGSTSATTFAGNVTTGGQVTVPSGYSVNIGTSRIHSTSTSYLLGGNVGIGVTSPSAKLHVMGTTGLPATSGTTFTGTMRLQVAGGYGTVMDFGAVGPSTGTQWIQVTDASNQAFHYPLLLQPNGGNVGIGTISPASTFGFSKTLEIQGAANAEVNISQTNNSKDWSLGIVNGSNYQQTTSGQAYVWESGATERMRITSDGDVRITTKGPSSAGVGAVYTPPYPLRINTFNGTGPKFLGVYPLRGGSQFLDIAINTTANNIMYYAMFRGYFYGRGSRWSWTAGYTYQGSIINVQNHFVLNGNAANLTAYRGAAGSAYPANLCFRMDSGSSGYTEGFGELYMFAHANSLQDAFQVAAFSENNAANPGLWT